MTKNDLNLLKEKIDTGRVTIFSKDGEEIVAKILSVSDEEQDVIFDIISTNRPNKYEGIMDAAHMLEFKDIESVASNNSNG